MFDLPERIVIFDLECTTWRGAAARNWSRPGEHREVVQCGAIRVETKNLTELDAFECLIKPKINPVLSEYFIQLTNISQEEVDGQGVDFSLFLDHFFRWTNGQELYCFDSRVDSSRLFDFDVLMENCKILKIRFPFKVQQFHNINMIFWYHGYEIKQSGSAPEAFGIALHHRPHNALNDVRGLIIALRALAEKKGGDA